MSIAIIRGPHAMTSGGAVRAPSVRVADAVSAAVSDGTIPKQVISQLVEHASMAHKTIAVRNCRSQAEMVDCLHQIGAARYEFVIFDPGICADNDDQVRAALNRLEVPYVEAHDDLCGALEPPLAPGFGPRLYLIQGYGAQSYTLALSIALEHLGCAECENDIHVGT